MKGTAMRYLLVLIVAAACFADVYPAWGASSERLIAGQKEFGCNHEANGALKIINEIRSGIPEDKWYELYPINDDYPDETKAIIKQAITDAYRFEGDAIEFMRKIYAECLHR